MNTLYRKKISKKKNANTGAIINNVGYNMRCFPDKKENPTLQFVISEK